MNDLYSTFFESFSKMECALKQTGYLRSQKGPAEADWDKFANSVGKQIFEIQDKNVKEALEYLKQEPPLTQMVTNGKIEWKKTQESHETCHFGYYTDAIKRIRNNLFHGGKFNLENGEDKTRNEKLVKYALTLLNECAKIKTDVNEIYQEAEW